MEKDKKKERKRASFDCFLKEMPKRGNPYIPDSANHEFV